MYVPNPMQRANMQLQSQYSQIDALQKQLDQLRNMANMQFQNQQVMQQQVIQPQQQMTAQGDPAMFTELIPIDSIEEGENWPLGIGDSKMFMTKDEKHICTKEVHKNNKIDFAIYDRRNDDAKIPSENEKQYLTKEDLTSIFNPNDYVKKDRIKDYVLAIMTGKETTEV